MTEEAASILVVDDEQSITDFVSYSLMKDAGKVVTREDLLREAWGWEYITETKTVDTHIKRLRDKISQAGFDPSIIETVRGYGYRLKA